MLSIIVPIYNEKKNIRALVTRIKASISERFELILVNDGSSDDSLKVIKSLQKDFLEIVIIDLNRNHGQTYALKKGIEKSKGKKIITIDGDLQNYPEDIPRLLKKLDRGFDVVCGIRKKRNDPLLKKKIPSIISNSLIRMLTKVKIKDSGCSLRAYKKSSLKKLHMFGEMHRYIPVILALQGFKIGQMKVRHARRKYGKTKYGIERFLRGILDLLFVLFLHRYSKRPLHFFGSLGILSIFTGFLFVILDLFILLVILEKSLVNINVGPVIMFALLLFFFGINFILLGFLSELMFVNFYKEK